jgi:ribonuclease P protein component
VRREGKRIRTEHLEVRALASLLPYARVGFVVPKYKRNGVARNQLKRRLREIVRTRVLPTLPPGDLVIRPNPAAYDLPFERLVSELAGAADRARRALGRPAPPPAPPPAPADPPPPAPLAP